jgi:hypothetical protein
LATPGVVLPGAAGCAPVGGAAARPGGRRRCRRRAGLTVAAVLSARPAAPGMVPPFDATHCANCARGTTSTAIGM